MLEALCFVPEFENPRAFSNNFNLMLKLFKILAINSISSEWLHWNCNKYTEVL